jgi:hypothetical protein
MLFKILRLGVVFEKRCNRKKTKVLKNKKKNWKTVMLKNFCCTKTKRKSNTMLEQNKL